MNVVFISELDFYGTVPENHTNLRTEFMWFKYFDAFHIPYSMFWNPTENYQEVLSESDLVILIPSKKHPEYLQVAFALNTMDVKFGIMQEGPVTYWQTWETEHQLVYLAIISKLSNVVFAHNQADKKYFEGLTEKPVFVLPTMHDVLTYREWRIDPEEKEESVLIGGNMTRWYGGMNSLQVALSSSVDKIYILTMGKRHRDEQNLIPQLDNRIEYVPYMDWKEFMKFLSKIKYAIHLMPESAAGSFSLNCAMLGVPCIGNKHNDTQTVCFPSLSFEPNDIQSAKNAMDKLTTDKQHELSVSNVAMHNALTFDIDKINLIEELEEIL